MKLNVIFSERNCINLGILLPISSIYLVSHLVTKALVMFFSCFIAKKKKKAPLKNLPQGNKQDTKIPGYSFENNNNPGTLLTWRTSWPVGRYGIFSGHRWTRLEHKKRSHKLSLKYFSLRSASSSFFLSSWTAALHVLPDKETHYFICSIRNW